MHGCMQVSLAYNTSTHHGLPPGVSEAALAAYNISGIKTAIDRYNTSGTVRGLFALPPAPHPAARLPCYDEAHDAASAVAAWHAT